MEDFWISVENRVCCGWDSRAPVGLPASSLTVTSKIHIDITFGRAYALDMARIPFTLRIDAAERVALKNLSEIEGRPMNQLLNEAIKFYLNRRGRKERGLEATLESLRKYRKQHARFQRASAAFVEAEASLDDPLEGDLMEGKLVEGQFKPAGPVQSRIRKLLRA